jgi:hypothetical protein
MNPNLVLGCVGSITTLVLLFEMMRRHRLREKYAVFWAIVALFALMVTVFPVTLVWMSDVVGVQLPSNLLFFLASMVLLVISIQHSHELGRLEERTRTLAEEVGLLRMAVARQPDEAVGTVSTEAPPNSVPLGPVRG